MLFHQTGLNVLDLFLSEDFEICRFHAALNNRALKSKLLYQNKISILCTSHLQLWAKTSDFLQAQGRRLKIISCTNVHCWLIHY